MVRFAERYTESKCKGYLTYPSNPKTNGIFLKEGYRPYYEVVLGNDKLMVYNVHPKLREEITKLGGSATLVRIPYTTGKTELFGIPVQVRKDKEKGILVTITVRVDGETIGEIDDKIKKIVLEVSEYYRVQPKICMWDKLAPDSTITSGMGISQPPYTPYPIHSESTIGKEAPRRHQKPLQQAEDEMLNEAIEIAKQRNDQDQIPPELRDRFAFLMNKLSQAHHISYADLEKYTGIAKPSIAQTVKEYQRNLKESHRENLAKEAQQQREEERRYQESKQEERKLVRDILT